MQKNKNQLLTTDNRQPTTIRRAFTLIELLVVTTIIVILTVIVVVNFEKARAKSRDSKRKADISAIAAAVEMYKAENKVYPVQTSFTEVVTAIIGPVFISTIPVDPTNDSAHKYEYKGDAGQFKVRAKSETVTGGTCTNAAVTVDAKLKAGDFYDPAPTSCTYFQVSSSVTALNNW